MAMTIHQRLDRASSEIETRNRCREFIGYARFLLRAKGGPAEALEYAVESRATPRIQAVLKSAVSVGGTDDPAWAGALTEHVEISTGFLQSLSPFSAFDTVLTDGAFRRVPLRSRVVVVTTAASASVVGEAAPKPITRLSLATQLLAIRKVVSICAFNDELTRSVEPAALNVIEDELRRAVAKKSDEVFLQILSETTGIASIPSTGMDAPSFVSDLASAIDQISFGAGANLYLVLPPATAKLVPFMQDAANGPVALFPDMGVLGGEISGIKVLVSDAATDAVLFDASQIAAASEIITIGVSNQADVQQDDAPASGPQNLVSLWQTNRLAMKAERYFGAEVLRPEAVCVITGVTA
jgi:HK97 family phage major capsid protein